MPKKLILLRHAEAEFTSLSNSDITRPLTARGLEAARRMALRMKNLGGAPELIVCSPATRTRQTADIVMDVLQLPSACLQVQEQVYNAPAGLLQALLSDKGTMGKASEVLLVGHNPGISDLAYQLRRHQDVGQGGGFTPGSFAVYEVDVEDWSDFSAQACSLRHFEMPD